MEPAIFIPTIIATPAIHSRTAKIFRQADSTFSMAYELPCSGFRRVLMAISRQARGVSAAADHDPEQHEQDEEELRHEKNHFSTSAILSPPQVYCPESRCQGKPFSRRLRASPVQSRCTSPTYFFHGKVCRYCRGGEGKP